MSDDSRQADSANWFEASGVPHLLKSFRLALHPSVLTLAIAGILMTSAVGVVLDKVWIQSENGVEKYALARYLGATDAPESENTHGIYKIFRDHQLYNIRDAVESIRMGRLLGDVGLGASATIEHAPEKVGDGGSLPARGVAVDLILMARGVGWMFRAHTCYALLFFSALLLIWGQCGGAISRIVAIRLTRNEYIPLPSAIQFASRKLLGGFALAPLLPLLMTLALGILLMLGGLFMRIPWLGDIVGGGLFFLAILGGMVIAFLLLGLVVGGPLFCPTIAVEGTDAFDAISRSLSYVYGRPLRALWYASVLVVYGAFGWLFVRLFAWIAMAATHYFVDIGTGGQLANIWIRPTFEQLHRVGENMDGSSWFAGVLISLWAILIVTSVWAFLVSYFFAGSTVAYFLLRREVDGYDLSDIYEEDDAPSPSPALPASTPSTTSMPSTTSTPSTPSTPETATPPDENVGAVESKPGKSGGESTHKKSKKSKQGKKKK